MYYSSSSSLPMCDREHPKKSVGLPYVHNINCDSGKKPCLPRFRFKLAQLSKFHVCVWSPTLECLGFFIDFHLMLMIHWCYDTGRASVEWSSETRLNLTPKPRTGWRLSECSLSLMCCQHFAVTRQRLIVRTKRWKELERCCLRPCAPTSADYPTEFLRSWMLKWFCDRVCLYGSWKSR